MAPLDKHWPAGLAVSSSIPTGGVNYQHDLIAFGLALLPSDRPVKFKILLKRTSKSTIINIFEQIQTELTLAGASNKCLNDP